MVRRVRLADIASHAASTALFVTAVVASARGNSPALTVAASVVLYLTLFSFQHDLMHAALGMNRATNARILTMTGLAMMQSGHSARRMHLRHHAQPLSDGDVEGEGARRSLLGAIAYGPVTAFQIWRAALSGSSRERWEATAAATIAAFALLFAVAGHTTFGIYAATALTMQMTASVWASHVPHHVPAVIAQGAARLAFLRSPVLLSLAFHEAHHRHPNIPCHALATVSVTAP